MYPNSTRILQPADVTLFFPLKTDWKVETELWRKDRPYESITRKDVAPILANVLRKRSHADTCSNGFRATGLYPWNPSAIDYSKCLGKKRAANEESAENTPPPAEEPPNTPSPEKLLSFQEFCSIVGNEKVEVLRAMEMQNQEANENILYQIWLKFQNKPASRSLSPLNGNEEGARSSSTGEAVQASSSSSSRVEDLVENSDVDEPSASGEADLETLSRESSEASLKNHLHWPEAPKRKGLRNVERMPFVISSQRYQEILNTKKQQKEAAETAKEERKRKREEKKRTAAGEKQPAAKKTRGRPKNKT